MWRWNFRFGPFTYSAPVRRERDQRPRRQGEDNQVAVLIILVVIALVVVGCYFLMGTVIER